MTAMKSNRNYKDKTVSVIVPAFNAQETIRKCIDGLIEQSFKPTEIIIVDDGSSDGTGSILDQYQRDYDNITVVHQLNLGVSAARNRGLSEICSEHIVFVDSDDWVGSDYIETLMRNSEYDYVTSGFHAQNHNLEWSEFLFVDEEQKTDVVREHPSKYLGKYYFGSPWAKLYKRSIIERLGLRFSTDIQIGEDIIFNFNYLMATETVRIIPLCEYYYSCHKSSLSHSSFSDDWKWTLAQEKLINVFFNGELSNSEDQFLQNREFDIMQRILWERREEWSKKQIREFYRNSVFQKAIDQRKTKGTFGEKVLLFALDKNRYCFYEIYLKLKNIFKKMVDQKI